MLVRVWIGNFVAPPPPPTVPPAAGVVPIDPVVSTYASQFARQLAIGAFAVHSFVGAAAPVRHIVQAAPVISAPARTVSPRVKSFIGKQTFVPAPAVVRVVGRPSISTARVQLPRVRSALPSSIGSSEERGPFPRAIVVSPRQQLPRVRSFLGLPLVRAVVARTRPIVSSLRTRLPITESFVGEPIPKIPAVTTPASSRARPIVASFRTKLPAVESFVGEPLPRVQSAAAPRIIAKPIVTAPRILRPIVDSVVLISPRVSRAPRALMPITSRIRRVFMRVRSAAGSGIARGPAQQGLQLAIAVSTGSVNAGADASQPTLDVVVPTSKVLVCS